MIDQQYTFNGPNGAETLGDLFDGRDQLLIYHFMFHPEWDAGCKSCSLLADSYNGAVIHLAQRNVTMVTVSIAPLDKLEAFKKRMGWNFKWVSSEGSNFNRDFHVSFNDQERESNTAYYNYHETSFPAPEAPGISAFIRQGDQIFHTYSSYGRGLDLLILSLIHI